METLKVCWVVPSVNAGGVGSVCRYAAVSLARKRGWKVTLVSLHDTPDHGSIEGLIDVVCLGAAANAPECFIAWLDQHPQHIVITNDVNYLEPAFPFLSTRTHHIVQIHDSGRRYRAVAVRNARWIDGVICVGRHIETKLQLELQQVAYRGSLQCIHNGADFPPPVDRTPSSRGIRLLFMGRVDPIKGAWDLPKILIRLRKLKLDFSLTIVGGYDEALARKFRRLKLDQFVRWVGVVPHRECYRISAENDLLLMLSRTEGFGMVTIEAMAMGCVPIAYNTPSGSTQIIEDGVSGVLVPLGDYNAVAHTIQRFSHEPDMLRACAQSAMDRARNSFNAELTAERMARFFTQLLKSEKLTYAQVDLPTSKCPSLGKRLSVLSYHRLPSWLRSWVRNTVHGYPRLSLWLLSR